MKGSSSSNVITQVLDVSDDDNADCDSDQYSSSNDQVDMSRCLTTSIDIICHTA